MAYATISEFKAWFGLPNSSDEDDVIQQALDAATAWFEGQTGRVFEAASDTERAFDAELDVDGDALYFDNLDLAQITSVVNGDGQAIDADDYQTMPRHHAPYFGIRLKLNAPVAWTYVDTPENAIRVTGRWAFSVTPPTDVKQAVLDIAHQFYKQRDTMVESAEPLPSPSGEMIAPRGLPKSVWSAVGRYKRRV